MEGGSNKGSGGTRGLGDILVVDDQIANVKVLVALLEEAGYRVRAATSGKAALMICAKRAPDLLLLDVMMPEMDGYEVCCRLQSEDKTRKLPVIFISALDNAGDKVRGFDAGAVDFISKPFDAAEVLVRVRTHMRLELLQRELEAKNRELERLAITDPLTGLYNRRHFLERLRECFALAERYHTPCSLVMFDLDHFKQVNDRFGHEDGDRVLQAVADATRDNLRSIDIPARWGGEEFIVLAPHTDLGEAVRLAERLRAALAALNLQPVGRVSASFGVVCDVSCNALEELTRRVDRALYMAKAEGRDCVRVYPCEEDGRQELGA